MSDQRKALWHCLLTTAIVVLALPCVAAAQVAAQCGDIHILSTELSSQDAEAYCQYAASERAKVEAFWGTTWQAPIRIHVDSVYRIAKALVPVYQGKRGFMEMPLRRVLNNDGGLVHEFVHIYAPNANRFLAEGLAVYLQARLGGNRAFPNFGEDIRRLAVRGITGLESLDALHRVQPPRPLGTVMEEKTAYILAGSFVGFIIERYGLASFRHVYETGNYAQVYGKSLGTLEQEWRVSLREH